MDGKILDVTTYKPGDGAPIGHARIAVFSSEADSWQASAERPTSPAGFSSNDMPPMVTASLIPGHYNDPRTSELTFQINAGTNEVELELLQ